MSRIATGGPTKAVGFHFGVETRDARLHCTTVVFYSAFTQESDWVSWTYGRGVKWVGDARNRIPTFFCFATGMVTVTKAAYVVQDEKQRGGSGSLRDRNSNAMDDSKTWPAYLSTDAFN